MSIRKENHYITASQDMMMVRDSKKPHDCGDQLPLPLAGCLCVEASLNVAIAYVQSIAVHVHVDVLYVRSHTAVCVHWGGGGVCEFVMYLKVCMLNITIALLAHVQ